MRIAQDTQRIVGVAGMILAFVLGTITEYSFRVLKSSSPRAMYGMSLVIGIAFIVAFGIVAFSEYDSV